MVTVKVRESLFERRLELRPWCRYSVKYKEQLERMKKSGRGVMKKVLITLLFYTTTWRQELYYF